MNTINQFSKKQIVQTYQLSKYASSNSRNRCQLKILCQPKYNICSILPHRRLFSTNQILRNATSTEDIVETKEEKASTEDDHSTTSDDTDTISSPDSGQKKNKRRSRVKRSFEWAAWNRPEAHLDIETENAIIKGDMKCRLRPIKVVNPPESVTKTINAILTGEVGVEKYGDIGDHFKQYFDAGQKFKTYLHQRKPSMEDETRSVNRSRIEARVRRKYEAEVDEPSTRYDELEKEAQIQKETERIFKERTTTFDHQSKHIQYDKSATWAYLLGRAAFDYATIRKIMIEIRDRTQIEKSDTTNMNLSHFQPRTIFDFGSGVGTSIWAARETFGEISEAFCVDSSKDMTDMAIALLTKGLSQNHLPAGYSFRLHLPRASEIKYDLVTCSHSLLHVPSTLERINVIDNLWRKTTNGGFLIVVENGTNAGFQVVQEARHYLSQIASGQKILNEYGKAESDEDDKNPASSENIDVENLQGSLYSPCPHSKKCPRYEFDTIPCSFDVRYRNFCLDKINKAVRENVEDGRFSYIVFRKGEGVCDNQWPRVVEPIKSIPVDHHVCRLCTNRGTLEEILLSNVNKGHKSDRLKSKKLVAKYGKSLNVGDQFKGHLECGFENYKDFAKWGREKVKTPIQHNS